MSILLVNELNLSLLNIKLIYNLNLMHRPKPHIRTFLEKEILDGNFRL